MERLRIVMMRVIFAPYFSRMDAIIGLLVFGAIGRGEYWAALIILVGGAALSAWGDARTRALAKGGA